MERPAGPRSESPVRSSRSPLLPKEYESSWIFEPCLTCANALRRVQHLAFSLGNLTHLPLQPATRSTQHTLHLTPYASSRPACTGWQPPRRSTLDPKSSEESSAPRRRLAASGATQWPPAGAAGSAARWQVASLPSVMVVECRVCRPQQHGSASHRRRGAKMSDAHCALLALSASSVSVRVSSVYPSGVRRVSGVRASGVRCPVSVSGAQSSVSDIGCPVSGVQCQRPASVRVASVSALSAPVGSWNARVRPAATRLGTGRVGVSPYPSAGQPVRGGSLTAAGCVEVGRSVLPAARHDLSPWVVGRPRWEVLGRQRERAPPRPKAAGGPQQQSGREGKPGLASENCGGPAET
jgi:hypothetical protein